MITDRDSVKTGKRRTRQRGRFVLPNRLPTMPTKQKLVFANDGGFFFLLPPSRFGHAGSYYDFLSESRLS